MVGLDTEQVRCLLNCAVAAPNITVLGVFSADRIPLRYSSTRGTVCLGSGEELTKSAAFIVNTDPHGMPGQHWLAFFYNIITHRIEYFDSFGQSLGAYPSVKVMLSRCSLDALCSTVNTIGMIQSPTTDVCGYYCVAFLQWRTAYPYAPVASFLSSLSALGPNRDSSISLRFRNVLCAATCAGGIQACCCRLLARFV